MTDRAGRPKEMLESPLTTCALFARARISFAQAAKVERDCSSVESVFMLAGAKVEFDGAYPGWQPDANSELLTTMTKIYMEKYGERPNVNVIHAGLECGIIQSRAGHKLDIVSFGPTITGAHSPDEAAHIPAVEKSYDYLLAILENVK